MRRPVHLRMDEFLQRYRLHACIAMYSRNRAIYKRRGEAELGMMHWSLQLTRGAATGRKRDPGAIVGRGKKRQRHAQRSFRYTFSAPLRFDAQPSVYYGINETAWDLHLLELYKTAREYARALNEQLEPRHVWEWKELCEAGERALSFFASETELLRDFIGLREEVHLVRRPQRTPFAGRSDAAAAHVDFGRALPARPSFRAEFYRRLFQRDFPQSAGERARDTAAL